MRHLVPLFASIALFGCASTSKQDTYTQGKQELVAAPSAKLKRGQDVLIALPKNGVFDYKEYRGSGQHTATAVQSAFAKFSDEVVVSTRCTDLPCLQSQGGSRYTYLIVPEILHWEDQKRSSDTPDQVEVKLVIFDSRSNAEIASTVISGKSTSSFFGGDKQPQDLLPEPMKQYAESLY